MSHPKIFISKKGNFSVCFGSMNSSSVFEHLNCDESSTSYLYLLEGGGTAQQNNIIKEVSAGNLYDLSEFKGSPINYETETGVTWAAININPEKKDIEIVKISGPFEDIIDPSEKHRTILCVKGEAILNDKIIKYFETGSLKPNKSLNVFLKENDEILIINDK